MGKYIDSDALKKQEVVPNNINNTSKVKMRPVSKDKISEVKNKVSIADYFDSIIVPQLGSYYSVYPVDFDNKPVACCPLHDEDTPSFRFYEETNSFYCFGCRKGGNVITLHRYFAEKIGDRVPEYEEATNFLYDYFIKNNDNAQFVEVQKQEKVKVSSDVDMVRYNIYKEEMEASITYDNTIDIKTKEAIWEIVDNIDILITKGIINALDAKGYIKNTIKNMIMHGGK